MSILLVALCSLGCGFGLAFARSVFLLVVLLALTTLAAIAAALFGDVGAGSVLALWLATALGLQFGYFLGLIAKAALRARGPARRAVRDESDAAGKLRPETILSGLKALASSQLKRF